MDKKIRTLPKKIIFSFIIYNFIFLNFLHASNIDADDYGCRWSQTLNFNLEDIQTGKNGNVFHYSNSNETNKFDINEIHKELKIAADNPSTTSSQSKNSVEVPKDRNIVVAGLSLIIKNGEDYHAVYTKLKEGENILAFLDGSSHPAYEKKSYNFIDHHKYEPIELFTEFGSRLNRTNQNFTGLKTINQLYKNWLTIQKIEVEKSKNKVENISKNSLDRNNTPIELLKEISTALEENIKTSNENYWSSVHSEQFFLRFLKERLIKETTLDPNKKNVSGKYIDLLTEYKTSEIKKIREIITNPLNNKKINLDEELKKRLTDNVNYAHRLIDNTNNIIEIGCILHLHSTNELCSCCATSISLEMNESPTFNLLRKTMNDHNENKYNDPFFLVLSSSSNTLPGDETENRASGIGKNNLPEEDYSDKEKNFFNLNEILKKRIFLQKRI